MTSKKKRFLFGLTAIVLIAFAVFIRCKAPTRQLSLIDDENGAIYANYPLHEGDSFSVRFKHSVNQSDTTDIYEIKNGKIVAIGARYSSFGAGMPGDIPTDQHIEYDADGFMVIRGMHIEMQRLCYIVGTINDHFLELNGESINLTELCGRNRAIVFTYNQ